MTSDSAGRIDIEHDGFVAVVTIANEARANSLDDAMLASLASQLEADALGDVRAVVLTGEGDRNFSGGVDLQARDGEALTDAVRTGERLLGRAHGAGRLPDRLGCGPTRVDAGVDGRGIVLAGHVGDTTPRGQQPPHGSGHAPPPRIAG
jgi:hypothetical protein